MRTSFQSTALSVGCLLLAAFCGFSGCEKSAVDEQSTRRVSEAAAVEKLKSETAKVMTWADERRPIRKWPPVLAAEWGYITNLEKRLQALSDKNLPDDLEVALEEYIRVFHEHPDLVAPQMQRGRYTGPSSDRARKLGAFAAAIQPVRERLRVVAKKYEVDLDEFVEEW